MFILFTGKTVKINRILAVASSRLICHLLKASGNTNEDCTIVFTATSERSLRLYKEAIYTGCSECEYKINNRQLLWGSPRVIFIFFTSLPYP